MKNIILILLIFTSCNLKNTNRENVLSENIVNDSIMQNIDSTKLIESEESNEVNSESMDDCIFDQNTQTDEFLKGIKELQDYKWDSVSKTATVTLDNGDTLLIKRGGCNSFGVSAEFKIIKDTTDYSNWNNVFKKILWISKVLDTEFAFEKIKDEIDSNKISIESYKEYDVVYFSSEYLQDNHYEIYRTLNENLKTIELSHYID